MIAASALALAAAALAPGFRFRLDPSDASRYRDPGLSPGSGVAVVLRTAEADRARVDLFVLAGDRLPRWKWTDAGLVAGGRVTLRAPARSTVLLHLPDGRGPGYRLDGPFRWPSEPAERELVARPARAVRGSSPFAGAPHELRVTGPDPIGDPLCESDGALVWQCAGVSRTFSGHIVACRDGGISGSAQVRPDSPGDAVLRPVSFGALLRVELAEPGPVRGPHRASPSVRVLRPPVPKGFVTRPDPRWIVSDIGNGLVWIETDAEVPEALIEVSAEGHATKRFALVRAEVGCADPISVLLARAPTLRGSVTGPDGSPVEAALVLVRSGRAREVLGDGETDANGEFEISGVEPGSHLVRACHGEHGCTEEPVQPGVPVVLRLPGKGTFIGRVLSGGGVPQAGAVVRILPTAEAWASADDRMTRLPLESRSGPDGRFRISAAENGNYLVEVRSASSGVARISVRRSNLSPAETDLGDLSLPEPIEFTARVSGCGSGWLFLSGPLGGETSLPSLARFRLDAEGSETVRLPEGGAWTAWASCSGRVEWIEPSFLPDTAALAGLEVRFERAGERRD
ncbi:MAG: carboxypeptidase-like regulatory domain-containing protein [Acidobacteriota bacterium]|nr:carboxypeptidase-like regulatory domain-containing protein [Acidobacteriota bacterium]